MSILPPPDFAVKLNPDAVTRDDWRTLAGGHPFHLLRLTDAGARCVRGWSGGGTVGETMVRRTLARRLLDADLLVPDCEPRRPGHDAVELVVPVHDSPERLRACLGALTVSQLPVTVVDDASPDPAGIATVAQGYDAKLVRLTDNRGPATARNLGLESTSAPLVAFVDADVVVTPDWLARLLPHFDDPKVGIAAPRVLALRRELTGIGRYETAHSSLDMGRRSGAVGPDKRIPYVPSAALVVRRSAAATGFDETLRFGEDVDLCWRAIGAGWRAVYDARAGVHHDHRTRTMAFMSRRWQYATSAGPLSQRHPEHLRPLRADLLTAGSLACAAAGHPLPAGALALWRGRRLQRRLGGDPGLAIQLLSADFQATTVGIAHAVRRAWLPAMIPWAAHSARGRAVIALAILLRLLAEDETRVRDLPYALIDDLVTAVATWSTCARHGTLVPLTPRLTFGEATANRPRTRSASATPRSLNSRAA